MFYVFVFTDKKIFNTQREIIINTQINDIIYQINLNQIYRINLKQQKVIEEIFKTKRVKLKEIYSVHR